METKQTRYKNRENYRIIQKSRVCAMLDAAVLVQDLKGCEDITDALARNIEAEFRNVPVRNKQKLLDDIAYFPNGLILNTKTTCLGYGNAIVGTPWELDIGQSAQERKQATSQNQKNMIQFIKKYEPLMYAQLCTYMGKPFKKTYRRVNEPTNVNKWIKFLAKCAKLHEKGLDTETVMPMKTIMRTCICVYVQLQETFEHNTYLDKEKLEKWAALYKADTNKWPYLMDEQRLFTRDRWGYHYGNWDHEYDTHIPKIFKDASLFIEDRPYEEIRIVMEMFDMLEKISGITDENLRLTCKKLHVLVEDLSCRSQIVQMIQDSRTDTGKGDAR